MDVVIQSKKRSWHKWAGAASALMLVTIVSVYSVGSTDSATQKVTRQTLTTAKVKHGVFNDALALRAKVEPQSVVFLDAVSGGRIEKKFLEKGQYVEKGQPLLQLSNRTLQLEAITREAQVSEQLNFLRNTQLAIETSNLNLQSDLTEYEYQIQQLVRQINQVTPLTKQGVIEAEKLKVLDEKLAYYKKRKALTLKRMETEGAIRQDQLEQLKESTKMLQASLVLVRENLSNLLITAPVSGHLSEFDADLGESKPSGARLGQIDLPDNYKLVAKVDEFYINDVEVGMRAAVLIDSEPHQLTVSKVDSAVEKSQFTIELNLPSGMQGLTRGQSLSVNLQLSDSEENTLLLKRGPYTSTSGANWVFVVDRDDPNYAHRKAIKVAGKNKNYYKIVSGLERGDEVVISSYASFSNAQRIKLN